MKTYPLIRIACAFACALGTLMSAGCDEAPRPPVGPSDVPGPVVTPAPVVTSVSPKGGAPEVAASVRIEGSGFLPGATVTMDGAATNVVVVNGTTITATTPAHAAGVVAVVVTNPDGKSSSLPAAFTFADLAIASVAPVAARPGSPVGILGAGFSTSVTVTMGGVPAAISSSSFSTIVVIVPDHDAGTADVVVTNPGGQSVTLTDGLRFTTLTISVSANEVTAGSELTVSWIVPDQEEPPNVRGTEHAIVLWSINTGKFVWGTTTDTSSGTRTIKAPKEPGEYQFQYKDFNDLRTPYDRVMGRSSVITVTAAAPSGSRP